jgi:hypothetical protein
VTLLVLVTAVVGCLVWFGTLQPAPGQGVTPDEDAVIEDYDAYVGDRVSVAGTVTSTDPLVIRLATDDGRSRLLTVDRARVDVATGDNLAVYGRLQPDSRIVAQNTVRKPGDTYLRTRLISAVAALWVLARALSHWKIRPSELRVVQSTDPKLRLPFRRTAEDDDA